MKHKEALELVVDLLAYSNVSIKTRETILEIMSSLSITRYNEGMDKAHEVLNKLEKKA